MLRFNGLLRSLAAMTAFAAIVAAPAAMAASAGQGGVPELTRQLHDLRARVDANQRDIAALSRDIEEVVQSIEDIQLIPGPPGEDAPNRDGDICRLFAALNEIYGAGLQWPAYCPAEDAIYQLGQRGPGGGTVFYITDGGHHGLEAALEDQPRARWGCPGVDIDGPDSRVIGTGLAATNALLEQCAEPGIAAARARNYLQGGYGDWFLPSFFELWEMIELQRDQGVDLGLDPARYYWSSSQHTATTAWAANGERDFIRGKHLNASVRAVRSF